ncbi:MULTISPECIES: hypothetical protein [Actinomadura]|uniref:Uncharacterized protein n=1 Tax=Actinomadura yumaensis TaxID=111807 RepID=A0ABW2CN84_9ACTN|nr:hypothetical protein [Actinomadura sp. J1-007]
MKLPGLAALVLVPALVLTGCGGGDKKDEAASTPPPPPSSAAAPETPAGSPAPTAQPKSGGDPRTAPANRFNDCVKRHGVKMPSPGTTRRPTDDEVKKVRDALQACVKSMSPPPATPK